VHDGGTRQAPQAGRHPRRRGAGPNGVQYVVLGCGINVRQADYPAGWPRE
jgi:hypothetical protein